MQIDKIGYWSELKLKIIKKYAHAYSTILTAQAKRYPLKHVYIDGFSGPGLHISCGARSGTLDTLVVMGKCTRLDGVGVGW